MALGRRECDPLDGIAAYNPPLVQLCIVCGWQPATRKGRCNSCSLFLRRHGPDEDVGEVAKGLGAGKRYGVRPQAVLALARTDSRWGRG